MENHITNSQEKRQFGRVKIPEPRMFHVYIPQSQKSWENQGIIQNIGLGGIYFLCDEKPPLNKDDIRYLTFDAVYNDQKIYRLKFYGSVVRIEHGLLDCSQFAVAVKFLSDPIYYPFYEISQSEIPAMDKLRIMYQYYTLNRKAHAVIQATPEIRDDKISGIKERINQGLYKIEAVKLAQSFSDNLVKR
jgi:Anti-sigma-28 factor, FlgM